MRIPPLIWFLILGTVCSISYVQPKSTGKHLRDISKDLKKSFPPFKSQAISFFKDLRNVASDKSKSSRSLQKEKKLINEGRNLFASARRAIDGYSFRILKSILNGYDNQKDRQISRTHTQMRELDPLANLTIITSEYFFDFYFCVVDKYFADNTTHEIVSVETTTSGGGGDGGGGDGSGGGGDGNGGGGDGGGGDGNGGGDDGDGSGGGDGNGGGGDGGGGDGSGGSGDGNGGGDDGAGSGGGDGNGSGDDGGGGDGSGGSGDGNGGGGDGGGGDGSGGDGGGDDGGGGDGSGGGDGGGGDGGGGDGGGGVGGGGDGGGGGGFDISGGGGFSTDPSTDLGPDLVNGTDPTPGPDDRPDGFLKKRKHAKKSHKRHNH